MWATGRIVTTFLFVAFLIALGLLVRQEHGGPPHTDFDLPGNEPASLYLPGTAGFIYEAVGISPRPVAERPTGVVLVHGYSADRVGMARLARRMAMSGYAVLTIDVHGHGRNRNPFADNFIGSSILRDDVKNAVDYLRNSQLVDPARIFVAGHSMGAGAVLDYAQQDQNLAGSVMISGGFGLWGPQRPRNSLFIFAQYDPAFLATLSRQIAGKLAGADPIELGRLYGAFANGSAVEVVRVARVDHFEILNSAEAARTIIQWLDGASGIKRNGEIRMADPRRATTGIAILLFVVLLVPFGWLIADLAPAWPRREQAGGWTGLAIVGAALLAALPLVAIVPPALFLSIEVAQELFSWLLAAGVLMVLWLALTNSIQWPQIRAGIAPTLFAAGLAAIAIYLAWQPLSATIHNLALTPERFVAAVFSMLLLLPFFLGFELLVRRGGVVISTVRGMLGRLLMLVVVAVGLQMGALPLVLGLLMIPLAIVFVMLEILAASIYSACGNLALIATVESAWLAWLLVAFMPIRIFI